MTSAAPLAILLVEDDPADQKLIRASLKSQRIASDLHVAASAEEGLTFLQSCRETSGRTAWPDLILLDLNMPGMGGKEFLRQIKADEVLKQIPVVIVTTSNSERDMVDGYRLQAAGYVHKPSSLDELKQVIGEIQDYWFVLCKLPRKEQSN
jgi:CheY-like chemotaxis protein